MRLIVAGGRDYRLTVRDLSRLKELCERIGVTEIIHGAASGVDTDAGRWGEANGYKVTPMPADWEAEGPVPRAAQGNIRNRRMASVADAVVLFKGGSGTADMRKAALERNLRVYDFRPEALARRSLWGSN